MSEHLPDLTILHEDNHVLGVLKPAGMPVQGDDSGDLSLLDTTREWIRIKYQKPGNVYCGMVHRLDRPTSGVVCFAKTSKAASRLSEQFRKRETTKIYCAVVHGTPSRKQDILEHSLVMEENPRITRVARKGERGVHAELYYHVIATHGGFSEIQIELRTGRKHQIRCQLAAIGCPIVGDLKYGAPHALDQGHAIALHAQRLEIAHPTRDERIIITAPLPPYWPHLA